MTVDALLCWDLRNSKSIRTEEIVWHLRNIRGSWLWLRHELSKFREALAAEVEHLRAIPAVHESQITIHESRAAPMPATVHPEIIKLARGIAAAHGLDPALVCAVIEQESAWNPWAVRYEPAFLSRYVAPLYTAGKLSATEAYTRSMSWGLMQVMGQVAREFGFAADSLPELCDPATGVELGCRVLAKRMARARGDVPAALLAWNGGANPSYPAEVLARTRNYSSSGD